jgi:hypothetical protein
MSQFTTRGSTNIVSGTNVAITIKIAKTDNSGFNISDKIKIEKINDLLVLSDGDTPVKYKDSISKSPSDFSSESSGYYYKRNKNIRFFEITINGTLNSSFNFKNPLQVTFTADGVGVEETISFKLERAQEKITIKTFTANKNIIQKNKATLELNFKIEGTVDKVCLFENGKLLNDTLVNTGKINNISQDLKGTHEYTLQATKEGKMVSKSLTVLYVEDSKVGTRTTPENYTIINFCASQEGDYLFALASVKNTSKLALFYTHEIDGKNWQDLNIENLENIKPYLLAPMVHIQSETEKQEGNLGRILFIGGGYLGSIEEDGNPGNKVAVIPLENNRSIFIDEMKDSKDSKNLKPRWGHTCVLFPKDNNQNTIWLFGGQNRSGNTTNEIWTSTDGVKWSQEQIPGWVPRVMHSACVSYEIESNIKVKKAIYLGGGFTKIGSDFLPDIWKYEHSSKKWEKVIDIPQPNNAIRSFGIGFGNSEYIGDTGIYTLTPSSPSLSKLKTDNGSPSTLDSDTVANAPKLNSFSQGVILTTYFKECLWFMNIYLGGSEGVTYSGLFYRIPTIQDTTIQFYNLNN